MSAYMCEGNVHIVALQKGTYHLPERDFRRDVNTGEWGEGEDHVEGRSGGEGKRDEVRAGAEVLGG